MSLPPISPVVSVVMPVHNAERFLAAAVDSILAQTFTDFELIAVDDGSADAGFVTLRLREGIHDRCNKDETNDSRKQPGSAA